MWTLQWRVSRFLYTNPKPKHRLLYEDDVDVAARRKQILYIYILI